MTRNRNRRYLDMAADAEAALVAGARDEQPVKGLTHGYYKYPARFSPAFVRAVIETFTEPGELCLDPHVGGGTTLVEALALGRNAIGVDISTLAEFVAKTKTRIFTESELNRLENWSQRVSHAIDIHKPGVHFSDYADLGYYKHLNHPKRWRLRKAIEQAIGSAVQLGDRRLEAFGRCAVLRTAQWALDSRAKQATVESFRQYLETTATQMVAGARELRESVKSHGVDVKIDVLNRSAAGLEEDARLAKRGTPKLVVTSPPYPGVHVLYHRWQVDGRKEAPLPFMIANKLDGAGSSYYTMGDRKHPELRTYFENIGKTMSSVAAIADINTVIVQMVAFSEPKWQLPRYLEVMKDVGLEECFLPSLRGRGDGRLRRSVPGRRWYSDQRGETPGSQEVVLLHRKMAEPRIARTRANTSLSGSLPLL